MPSWFPFPDAIKKRACGYLIQRYLGQYLEQKLGLEQLEINLLAGKGSISDILLNVEVSYNGLSCFDLSLSGSALRFTALHDLTLKTTVFPSMTRYVFSCSGSQRVGCRSITSFRVPRWLPSRDIRLCSVGSSPFGKLNSRSQWTASHRSAETKGVGCP
jgi:hypothetical protein